MIPYLSPAGFKVFAHRGSTEGGAAENTLAAFQYAFDAGARYLETDVQATKDGVAVLFHDATLKRVAGINKPVAAFTYSELANMKLQGMGRITRLEDLLNRLPNARINIDVKTSDAVVPCANAVNHANAASRVLVSSFSRKRRMNCIKLIPGVATSTDASSLLKLWVSWKLRSNRALVRNSQEFNALQIPLRFGPLRFDSEEFIEAMHGLKLEVHYWTINDIDEVLRLRQLGADGIVTDKAKMVVERLVQRKR